ncbi:MAG: 4-hydroxythreonine-4-phosphate dehydrogenase PdxA [Bacteroidales bacterium]|nr:4-hydroxythreonine-4-phosphate dehydrogenase PdxA [Bacteroidales bacterium]
MEKKLPVVGISQGDINGIGYEVILKTLADPIIFDFCTPVIYGSAKVGAYHRKALNINNLGFNIIKDPEEAEPRKINVINCINEEVRVEIGKATSQSGEAAFLALDRATNDLVNKKIDVLVTAPIDKYTIQSDKFHFNGHTEFLQEKDNASESLMFLVSDFLRVGVVTGHVPLKDVASNITEEAILKKLRLMDKSLRIDFNIRRPRIAILGLNPHAGDNSLLGTEERDVIIPAMKKAEEEDLLVFGPFPSDGFFGSGAFKKFDAVLAMYHDQGLIPFKALTFDAGVNFTAGLSFVRTSPDHGTAFNIAGKGEASERSFREALILGCHVFKNRLFNEELSKNPLKHQELDTRFDKKDELPPEIEETQD